MELETQAIWSAAGVLAGFQVAAFSLRVNREIAVADRGDFTWLPPADLLNLASLTVMMLGVFVAPILGLWDGEVAGSCLGLAVVLLAGYPFALAGHYDMYTPGPRTFAPFPLQERIAVACTLLTALAYLGAV